MSNLTVTLCLLILSLHFPFFCVIFHIRYWVGQKVHLIFSIKDTFSIFTNNFIDLDILRVSAITCYWLLVGRGQKVPLNIFQCIRQSHSKELLGQNVNSTKKLHKPLKTRSISHSTFSINCTNCFLRFSCVFTFLETIKHSMPKMLHISFIFNVKMAAQKFTNYDV